MQFECQGSGKCCLSRGEFGYVYLTLSDRRRISKALKLSVGEFTRKFCVETDGLYHLKDPEKDCQFLEKNRCTIYEARPEQCRTWPFWPENMKARVWKVDVASYCPGVGKGRLISAEEIQRILKSQE